MYLIKSFIGAPLLQKLEYEIWPVGILILYFTLKMKGVLNMTVKVLITRTVPQEKGREMLRLSMK